MGITHMRVDFCGDSGRVSYRNATGEHVLEFGLGWNKAGVFPETYYPGDKIDVPKGEGYKCMTSAAWADEKTLMLCCYAIDDYFGMLKIQFCIRRGRPYHIHGQGGRKDFLTSIKALPADISEIRRNRGIVLISNTGGYSQWGIVKKA